MRNSNQAVRLALPIVLLGAMVLAGCASTAEVNAEYRDQPVSTWPSVTAIATMRD